MIIKIDIDTVLNLFNKGLGSRRIANEMNCSRDEVRKVFKKFNLKQTKWRILNACSRELNIDYIIKKVNNDNVNNCWEWQGTKNKYGYGVITYNGKRRLLHRVVYEIVIGLIPDNLLVCHKCDNPKCCNPQHLFLGDGSANMVDCILKDRNPNARINAKDVREIRTRAENGEAPGIIAKDFSLSVYHTKNIIKRRKWKYVV